VDECKIKRKAFVDAHRMWLPTSKHEIYSNAGVWGGLKKSVAIFDPDTNMLVKQYSTISGATQAMMYMSNELNYDFGPKTMNLPNAKLALRQSSKNPSYLIYGYRWIFLQDLRDGKISLEKASKASGEGEIYVETTKQNSVVIKKCLVSE
jgi:hypothetical protein